MKVIDIVYNIHIYINYSISVFIGFLQSHIYKAFKTIKWIEIS